MNIKYGVIILFTSLALLVTGCASSSSDPEVIAGAGETQVIEVQATVASVNYDDRTITLTDNQGDTATYSVGDQVTNFDQIKQGDVITMDYLQSIVVAITTKGSGAGVQYSNADAAAAQGSSPAAASASTIEVTAVITSVNSSNRTITLKGPEGATKTVAVSSDFKDFDKIKVGDEIHIAYTQAVAVSVSVAQ